MIKKLVSHLGEYKRAAVLTPLFAALEAVMDVLLPTIMAFIIDQGIEKGDMNAILKYGLLTFLVAVVALALGVLAGKYAAEASTGFAGNLRDAMYENIQHFSFSNIDKYSTAGLVTRMTTDVSNVQMSYMMLIRTAVRAPLMLIFAITMAFIMGGKLALTFVVVVPFLLASLLIIGKTAMPAFRRVFKKYDRLNESIEENVRGMRVVKGFSREEYEKQKFAAAAEDIRRDFTKAERIVALNNPAMQICVYFNMAFVLLIGSRLIISSGGSTINVGEMSAMLTYGIQVLMQLMMLSMIYVILTMSAESARRIVEVLDEKSSLESPADAVMSVPDGSIDFDGVSFKYSEAADRYALENVDLHIKSGMTVGIIGGTGSSKTTLVQLIPRLYDATVGSVRVGGIDVKRYDLDTLRDSVAMVLQKNDSINILKYYYPFFNHNC